MDGQGLLMWTPIVDRSGGLTAPTSWTEMGDGSGARWTPNVVPSGHRSWATRWAQLGRGSGANWAQIVGGIGGPSALMMAAQTSGHWRPTRGISWTAIHNRMGVQNRGNIGRPPKRELDGHAKVGAHRACPQSRMQGAGLFYLKFF